MFLASLISENAVRNNVFTQDASNSRDDCLYFYRLLRNEFLTNGIELNTVDVNHLGACQAELHINAQQPAAADNAYLVLFESSVVYPNNGDIQRFDGFRKIFTWNDDLVASDSHRFIKINYPNNMVVFAEGDISNRSKLCCMIAGNKTVQTYDSRELYSERIKTIRWFERHQPQDFDLFGVGWNAPGRMRGLSGRVINKVFSVLPPNSNIFFPSYKGAVNAKADAYARYLFTICYENVKELRGYITEKIFDAMCSGCVPVYWGATNVTDYIPVDCFIDRRQFSSNEALYSFLKGMGEKEYLRYQYAIRDFLSSPQAWLFSAEAFSKTVVNAIVSDLRGQRIAF